MSKYDNASQTIKRLALRYEGMMEAAQVLDELGSVEQAIEAGKSAAAAETARAESIRSVNAEIERKGLEAQAEQDKRRKDTDTACAKAILDANTRATAIVAEAEGRAGNITGEAEATAKRAHDDLVGKSSAIQADISRLNLELAALEERRRKATGEAEKAEERLTGIKSQIEALARA